jgi:hypothetical protein
MYVIIKQGKIQYNRKTIMQTFTEIVYQSEIDKLEYYSNIFSNLEKIGVKFVKPVPYLNLVGRRSLSSISLLKSNKHFAFVIHIVIYEGKLNLLLVIDDDTKCPSVFRQAVVEDQTSSTLEKSLSTYDRWHVVKVMLNIILDEFNFVKNQSGSITIPNDLYQQGEILNMIQVKLG